MKQLRFYLLAATMVIVASMAVSCSSSDDTKEDENKKVEGISWKSQEASPHSTSSVAIDKTEPNSVIQSKMQQMVGLKYTEETKTEEGYMFWDLCQKAGHDCDSTMTASFNSNKCTFSIKVTRTRVKAKQTKTENLYKFEEGSYIVRVGSSLYEGITVYSYGVYRADQSLFIPLDGHGCVAYETKYTYADKEVLNEEVENYTVLADYTISNNQITFSYNKDGKNITFSGTLSSDGQNISFVNNPMVSSVKTLRK